MVFLKNTGTVRMVFLENIGTLIVCMVFPKQASDFKFLHYKSFENTVEKGEIARCKQFLLFPQ